MIFITHDLTSITYFCDRVLILQEGRIKAMSKVEELTSVRNEYAEKLLSSVLEFET